MPTVPVYRTNETYQAAPAKSVAGLQQNTILQQAAKAVSQVVDAVGQIHQEQVQKDAAPIIAQASTSIELQLNKALNDAQTQMAPGGKGFAQGFSSTANEILQGNLAGIENPVAKRTLQNFGQQQLARFGQSAQDIEAREAKGYQNQQHIDGINGSAQIVSMDPSQYGQQLANNQLLINASPLDPESKRTLLKYNQSTLSTSAALAATNSDPRSVVAWMTGRSTINAPGNPDDPRGIRNNNPLNVRKSAATWDGATPGPDQDYETFASPAAGLRAGLMNAVHQSKKNGASTLSSLIPILAPRADGNDTDKYIADISARMGIDPNAKLDLTNKGALSAFGKAMTAHENGKQPYTDEQFENAADAALSGAPAADSSEQSSDPHPSAPAWVRGLTPAQRQEYLQRAQAQIVKQQTQVRSAVTGKMENDMAAWRAGIPVQSPLSSSQILGAYPDSSAHDRLAEYESAQKTGAALSKMAYMTDGQISDYLTKSMPSSDGPGMKAQISDHEILLNAAQKVISDRATDPIAFAQKASLAPVQPIDFSSPDSMASSIAARAPVASTMQSKFGTSRRLLTKQETTQFAQTVSSAGPDQKIQILGSLMKSLSPSDYDGVTAFIKQVDPVTEYAAVIFASGRKGVSGINSHWFSPDTVTYVAPEQVARTLLQGQAALHPVKGESPIAMPSDSDVTGLRKSFGDAVGDAYAGSPDAYNQAYAAYKAAYAGIAMQQGKVGSDVSDDIASQAAHEVIGDSDKWNGHTVIPPYGMTFNSFKKAVQSQWDGIKAAVPHGSDADIESLNLHMIGPGSYAVASGTSPIYGSDGRPVVIRVGAN